MLFINGFVKNITVSEDLMEDTFMEFMIHRHCFRGESSLKTYLFKIARNKALNYLKKNKYMLEIPENLEDKKQFEEQILTNEANKTLHLAIKKLSEDYAMVLYLLYFEKLSYNEIGKVMKKSEKQIKNLAYRARNSLKEILIKEEFDYEK